MEGQGSSDVKPSINLGYLSALCYSYAWQGCPWRERRNGKGDQPSTTREIAPLEYFKLRVDVIVAGEERKEDIGGIVDLGCGCGVRTAVELKCGPFVLLFELARRRGI